MDGGDQPVERKRDGDGDGSEGGKRDGPPIPLPSGARVELLSPDLALIELNEPTPVLPDDLSDAERDIARRIFEGQSNAQIAAERGVHPGTVGKQVERVYRKLGVASRAELVLAPRPRLRVSDFRRGCRAAWNRWAATAMCSRKEAVGRRGRRRTHELV